MRFTPFAAILYATLANAQSRSDIPSCALPCLDSSIKKVTTCAIDDFECVCKNVSSIQGDATPCVLKSCGQDTALNKVLPATQELCKEVANRGGKSTATSHSFDGSTPVISTEQATKTAVISTTEAPVSSATAGAATDIALAAGAAFVALAAFVL